MTDEFTLRVAGIADVPALYALIADNLEVGHLLPRTVEDLEQHAHRFIVVETGGVVMACAELAPLGQDVAEVRSLVVHEAFRGRHIGPELVARLATDAAARGFSTLCAFTHEPSHFVRLGFSIVPHVWVPEKIAIDCVGCSQFRHCGQYAVTLALRAGAGLRLEQTAPPARAVSGPRTSVERLRLLPITA